MKKIILYILGPGIFLGLFYVALIIIVSPQIAFQSLESTTEKGAPVFNKIQWQAGWHEDVWLMAQSHHGFSTDTQKWDRLAIVVNKRTSVAKFYQLSPGPLKWSGPADAQPLKARCFACHSNGPRAIRADYSSMTVKPNPWQRLAINIWNLRLKTYGRLQSVEGQMFSEGTSFRSSLPVLKLGLNLISCQKCHSLSGIRNPLTLEQLGTASFLVKKGLMPPFPFVADSEDIATLDRLVN